MTIEMLALVILGLVSLAALGALTVVCYFAILRERKNAQPVTRAESMNVPAPRVAFFSGPQGVSPPKTAEVKK